MITLSEAGKIREQFKPAFAGYLTDGDISERDVLATLLDLSVRGYIKLDMEKKGGRYEVHNVIKQKESTRALLPFEKEFLDDLFLVGDELTADDVRFIFKTRSLCKTIERNLWNLKENKIIESELRIQTDKGKKIKLLDYFKKVPEPVDTVEEYNRYMKNRKIMYAIFVVIGFIIFHYGQVVADSDNLIFSIARGGYSLGITQSSLLMFIGAVIVMGLNLDYIISTRRIKKYRKTLHAEFNDVIPYTKKKYEELFEFIQKFPFKEQRIYNEFMPFAVAFGLDTSWNKSFRIPQEPVISSKINK